MYQTGSGPTTAREGIADRLNSINEVVDACHSLVGELLNKLGLPEPTDATKPTPTPLGIAGQTQDIRGGLVALRERLSFVVGGL